MKQSLFLSVFLLLSNSFNLHAAAWEKVAKKYDSDLLLLARDTEVFAKDFLPDNLEEALQAGNILALSAYYNPYVDKKLGKEGQSIEDFKKQNSSQINQINKSNLLMLERNATEEKSLSFEEAKSLLLKSSEIAKNYIDHLPGPCFLRSTHIVHELSQKYPSVPAMKVWLFGSFYNRVNNKNRWNYHTAPAIPVRIDGKIQWMILDTLVVKAGPLTLEDWVSETHKNYKFTSRLQVVFSSVDKIGPFMGPTLYKLSYLRNGVPSVKSLVEADLAHN